MNNVKIPIVIATNNKGKTEEIREYLKGFPVNLKNLNDFGPIPPVIEDEETFDDNAYKKSSHTARIIGLPALADDSGLVVEALDGAPGVYSARYAGENATDEQLCSKLLNEMDGKDNRNAFFECVLSIAVPTGPALTYEARCHGLITEKPTGENGFGYDPVFYYPELDKTFAEMNLGEKGRVSHRGLALRELAGEFEKVLVWIRQNMPVQEKFECRS
jgi:XTP/dITP diphosphohydrolase